MADTPNYQHILVERRGRVELITLNRPEKLNAWTGVMEREFISAINRAANDTDVGAVVVTGAGRGFCAGADIGGWSQDIATRDQRRPASPNLAQDGSPEVPHALTRGKPAIAAINGPSIGIGLTMPLACDVRIASDRASFSARFVRIGLTPECGSTRYLPLVAGLPNALYLAMTGRIVDANEALARRLIDRVVPHATLLDEAMALAEEIAANPSDAVWGAKRMLHENATEQNLRNVVNREVHMIREMRRLPDHAEAVSAFMEKRQPKFH
jgi:2-(1,2-epoxy-1,2-dihydrophenyl)acetyl-CoA isomerase